MTHNLAPCEFRQRRPLAGGGEEIVCRAAQSARLAVDGQDEGSRLAEICGHCPIPGAIADNPAACLFLRPIRFIADPERAPAYFTCRWYYAIRSGEQPTDTRWCQGCRDWFPRPPLELIQGYEAENERIHRYILTGDDGRTRFRWASSDEVAPHDFTGWRRIRFVLQRWVMLLRLRWQQRQRSSTSDH